MSFLRVLLPLSSSLHVVDQLPIGVVLHLEKIRIWLKRNLLHLLNLKVAVLAHGAQPPLHLLLDLLHVLDHARWISWDMVIPPNWMVC